MHIDTCHKIATKDSCHLAHIRWQNCSKKIRQTLPDFPDLPWKTVILTRIFKQQSFRGIKAIEILHNTIMEYIDSFTVAYRTTVWTQKRSTIEFWLLAFEFLKNIIIRLF